jgi:nicotinate-nucleotide--dimethylbenzimidazole phosphoribosyltransferase
LTTPTPIPRVVLLDVGGTLVREATGGTAVPDLVAHPLPGVVDDLQALVAAGHRLAAVTNTTVMGAVDVRGLLGPSGLDGLLAEVVTSVEVGVAKPDPRPLLVACARMGVAPGDTVYLGDRSTDRDAALAAGMPFAWAGDGPGAALAWRCGGGPLAAALDAITAVDDAAAAQADARQARLTKPTGSLGRLEVVGARLAAIAGACPPPSPEPAAVVVFAGDHGVVASGVTPWPQEVTALMVQTFAAGGAAICVLARGVGATVDVVDVGVASPLDPGLAIHHRRVRPGTDDLSAGPAMAVADVRAALDVGADVARGVLERGARCLVPGDMGIGNTTASAAVIAALTGRAPGDVTGRGTGIDDATWRHKVAVVEGALARLDGRVDPLVVLAEVGGLEIAAMAGAMVAGAAARVPVVVDGVIACAAALVAVELDPRVVGYLVAGHRSTEPGATAALAHLHLDPLLDLGLRLGEGTGACLAVPLLRAAAAILTEMATFDDAGIAAET